jgi:galactonate dehydratase
MKISQVEVLHCDAGWRPWSFIRIATEEGVVGYSECTDTMGSPRGVAGVVQDLEPLLIGRDPRAVETLYWDMYRSARMSAGGIVQKAIGA